MVALFIIFAFTGCAQSPLPEPQESADALAGIDGTIVIWDWNRDAMLMYVEEFNKTHPDITVEIQDVAWDAYMTRLQSSFVAGLDLPDILLGEIAWRGTLFEMGIVENLEQAPYNLDRSKMVPSSIPLNTGPSGNIVGLCMQVTPAGFAYKRDVALEFLGTDDPDEVGAMIADWDTFLETGLHVLEASGGRVKMLPSLGDVLLSTLSQNIVDFVDGDTIDITGRTQRPLEITTQMRDANIIGTIEMYSAAWYAAYASSDFLFHPAAAWAPPFVITPNDPDGYGNWAITLPPEGAFNLGGTSLSINSGSQNKEAAWAFLEYIFFSESGGDLMYNLTGNYTSYLPFYEGDYSPFNIEGPFDRFFDGQSLVQFYINTAAPQARTAMQTRYDPMIDSVFQRITPVLMSDLTLDAQGALQMFIDEFRLILDTDADVI